MKSRKCLCLILDTCGFVSCLKCIAVAYRSRYEWKGGDEFAEPQKAVFQSNNLMLLRRSCAVEPPSCLCHSLLQEKADFFPGILALPHCPTVSMQVICTDRIHANTDPPPHFGVCKAEEDKALRMAIAHSKKRAK